VVIVVQTTVQVNEKTLQMLNELKKEIGARNHEVIRMLISERKKIPRSMFGSNLNLRSFSREDEYL